MEGGGYWGKRVGGMSLSGEERCGVRSEEWGVGSGKCEVLCVEFKYGVRSLVCRVELKKFVVQRSAEYGVRV